MTLREQFRKEKNIIGGKKWINYVNWGSYEKDYVNWLEAKINFIDS